MKEMMASLEKFYATYFPPKRTPEMEQLAQEIEWHQNHCPACFERTCGTDIDALENRYYDLEMEMEMEANNKCN